VFAQFARLPEGTVSCHGGWRVPFLVSILLVGGVGLIIRVRILETPALRARVKQARTEARRPIVEVLQKPSEKRLLLAMGARLAENGAFYIYTVFVPSLRERRESGWIGKRFLHGVLICGGRGAAVRDPGLWCAVLIGWGTTTGSTCSAPV